MQKRQGIAIQAQSTNILERLKYLQQCGEKNKDNLLAELKEDFLKDKNRPCAAQDGERLTGKEGVRYASHGGPEQGLDSTLETKEMHFSP